MHATQVSASNVTALQQSAAASGAAADTACSVVREAHRKQEGAPAAATVGDRGNSADDKADDEANTVWSAHTDKTNNRTYYHNHITKESQWTKPSDFMTAVRYKKSPTAASALSGARVTARVSDASVAESGMHSGGAAADESRDRGAVAAASAATTNNDAAPTKNDSVSRLKRAIDDGHLDSATFKRLQAVYMLLKHCEHNKCVVLRIASAPEDNCILGFASFVITAHTAFIAQLQHMVNEKDSDLWAGYPVREGAQVHLRAESIVSQLLKEISVFPGLPATKSWVFNKEKEWAGIAARAAAKDAAHAAAGQLRSGAEDEAHSDREQRSDLAIVGHMADAAQTKQHSTAHTHATGTAASASHHHVQHAQQGGSHDLPAQQKPFPSKAAKDRARAADQAALEAQKR